MRTDEWHAGRRPHIITVTSGKGGVGKTSLVANLGLELARQGASVVLVEGDGQLRDLSVLLNLVALGPALIGDDGDIQVAPGLRLVPGHWRALVPAQRAKPLYGADVDFVLIDTGSGVSAPVLELVDLATRTLVVTTHEPTAVAGAYAVFEAAHRRGSKRLDVVLNMAISHQAARDTHARLSTLIERHLRMCPALVAVIPRDESVGTAVMRREPMNLIFPYARATRAVAALALTLVGSEENHDERSRLPLAVRDRW